MAVAAEEVDVFDEISGLPVHVLVVHAAVVFTPLAGALGIVFALVAKWRWLVRWPMVGASVLALAAVFVAVQSGKIFRDRLGLSHEFIRAHAEAGQLLLYVMLGFVVVVGVAAYALGGPSALRSGAGARTGAPQPAQVVLATVLVVACVVVGYQVYRTGDAGARATWGHSTGG